MDYVIADNYLCSLALLEMILKENGRNISQYDLAEIVGITVPEKYSGSVKNIVYSHDLNNYGVNLTPEKLCQFFAKNGVAVDVIYLDALRINEIELNVILEKYIEQGKYVVFAFSYGVLYGKTLLSNLGHVSLLERVISDDIIQIYDPGPDNSGVKCVRISDMYDAMRQKGGLYIFTKQ